MEKLEFGSLIINKIKCSNNCVFCRAQENKGYPDLRRKDEIKLYKDVIFFIKNKVKNLDITGTEPLKYSKIIPFLKWIRRYFKRITILDPGNILHNKEFTLKLINTDFDEIIIPIYGSKAEIHNACVQNPKAFDQLIQGLDFLFKYKKPNQHVELTTIILKQNKKNIIDLIKFIKERYDIKHFTIHNVVMSKDGVAKFYDDFGVHFNEIKQIITNIIKTNDFEDIEFMINYVPLCLFNHDELNLIKKRKIKFLNLFYTYYLPNSKEWKDHAKYVKEYRSLVYHNKCNECYLKQKGMCNGILKEHYHKNKDFDYHPISKESYENIKDKIIFRQINPKKELTQLKE